MNLELQNPAGRRLPVRFAELRGDIIVVKWTATFGAGDEKYECRLQDGYVVRDSRMRFWSLTVESMRKVRAAFGSPTTKKTWR